MKITIHIPKKYLESEDYLQDIEETIANLDGVNDYSINLESIDIDYDDDIISEKELVSAMSDIGFVNSEKSHKESYVDKENKSEKHNTNRQAGQSSISSTTHSAFRPASHKITDYTSDKQYSDKQYAKKEVKEEKAEGEGMKTKIYIPDIECDSCSRLIEKKMGRINGVANYKIHTDSIDIVYDDDMIKAEDFVTAIEDLGFRASVRPFERKSFSERWRDYRENPHKYAMVNKTLAYGFFTFILLLAIQAVAYVGFLNSSIPNFISHYAWWLIYLDLSIATIGASIWYMASYKGTVTCMTGMMIGMTVGMQAGMMIGAVVGGTNGFFTGATVGMTIAVIAGTLTGAVSGIMGAVQGMMSGVMAGTMGAMVTVMMFTDRVLLFMPYYMIINAIILFGLIYLFYEEVVEGKKDLKKKSLDYMTFASACIVITAIISLIIIYGPKSPLFA